MASPVVAFLGLGFMGAGQAANIARAGFRLKVWNRTASKASAWVEANGLGDLATLSIATSVAEAVDGADLVLACLASERASETVLLDGPTSVMGALGRARAPASAAAAAAAPKRRVVVVDHSTVSPAFSARCHAAADEAGALFLDAPISGGPEGARAGTLAIMVGGDSAGFESCRGVFDAMGKTVIHMGAAGTGTAAKLANQLLVGAHAIAAAEALALASSLGLKGHESLRQLLTLLEHSYGNSKILQRCGAIIAAAEESGERAEAEPLRASAAPLRLLSKDLRFISACASDAGLDLPLTSAATSAFGALESDGMGDGDMALSFYRISKESASASEGDATAKAATGSAAGAGRE